MKMEDIRHFWKKKNEEDSRSGRLENERKTSKKLENSENVQVSGIKKLENDRYIDVKKLDKCEFDNMRMCIEHRCVAEKISVKVSRFKKNVGFVKETVTKLKCTGSRNCGPVVSENSAVHLYSTPAAPDHSQDFVGRLPTLQGENDCDWLAENNGKETRDVIGGEP